LLELGAQEIFAVEKDRHCLPILTQIQSLSQGRLTLIEGDALKITPQDLTKSPFKIVANLPYNIGTALLIQWLRKLENIQSLTLMFQKEVALRIIAKPRTKEYGRLSILCQWLCHSKKLFDLPPSAFFPSPKVTSSVVQLVPRPLPAEEIKMLPYLERITHDAFGQRRKMLRTSLKNLIPQETFEALDINPQSRAEELSVAQFIQLANVLHSHAISGKA
jgi:16S rRNA (adenine1518-N6/adenine1519-N6)-dimethyltransferase